MINKLVHNSTKTETKKFGSYVGEYLGELDIAQMKISDSTLSALMDNHVRTVYQLSLIKNLSDLDRIGAKRAEEIKKAFNELERELIQSHKEMKERRSIQYRNKQRKKAKKILRQQVIKHLDFKLDNMHGYDLDQIIAGKSRELTLYLYLTQSELC